MNDVLFETSCKFNQSELIEPTKYLCKLQLKNKKNILGVRFANIMIIITFLNSLYEIYNISRPVLSTQLSFSFNEFLQLNSIHIKILVILFFLCILVNFRKFILEIIYLKFFNKIFKFPNKYIVTNDYLSFKFYPPKKPEQIITIKFKEIKKIIKFDSNLLGIVYDHNTHIFIKLNDDSDLYASLKKICLLHSLIID